MANSYIYIGSIYTYQGNYEKGLENHLASLKISEALGNRSGMANSYNSIGNLYNRQGNYDKALENYFASLKIKEALGDKLSVAKTYNNIGSIYLNQGNYDKALEIQFAGLKIKEALGDRSSIAGSHTNIGIIYCELKNYDKALENHFISLKISEALGSKSDIAGSYISIGIVYNKQGNYDKALEKYFASLKIFEVLENRPAIAAAYINIGIIYFNQAELLRNPESKAQREQLYDKALENYSAALKITEAIGDKLNTVLSHLNIGSVYFRQDNIVKAKEQALMGLVVSKNINVKSPILSLYQALSRCDSAVGNYKGAYEYYKLFKEMNDSLFNIESSEKTAKMTAMYDGEKKETQIKLLEKDKEMQIEVAAADKKRLLAEADKNIIAAEAVKNIALAESDKKTAIADKKRILAETDKKNTLLEADNNKAIAEVEKKKQRTIIYSVVGGLLLVLVFAGFMYNRWRITRQQKVIIEQKEKETSLQKNLIEEKHKEITDSINYAERIQRSFLATTEMLDQNLKDYFVFFKPKDVVSGDFYWAGELNNGNFAFSVADSTGHGVPGAIMSILNISSLEKSIEKETDPNQILNETRKIIIERLKKDGSSEGGKDGMDCSLLVFNQDRTQLTFAAANNPVFIVRNNGLMEYKPDKMPVGKHDNDTRSFTLHTVLLQKGDVIYTLTDGFPDQFGGTNGKKYMIKNLKEFFLKIAHLSVHEQKQKLSNEFIAWKAGNEQVDDVCVIGIRL